tara:strand:- start:12 stop:446 length:435 start_codon:yes stop_codon:yes gene_type:complete
MAKISELTVRQGNVDVEGTIKEIGEIKNFNKFGRELRVADAILEDDSGTVKLSLWNNDVEKFKAGDQVKITNGYVNEFQGEKQLTAGKFGKMEKLGEGEASDSGQEELPNEEKAEESKEEAPAEESEEKTEEPEEKPAEDSEEF